MAGAEGCQQAAPAWFTVKHPAAAFFWFYWAQTLVATTASCVKQDSVAVTKFAPDSTFSVVVAVCLTAGQVNALFSQVTC